MHRLTILVTDPEQRATLAAVRALGSRGHRVVLIGKQAGLAGRSRYAHGVELVAADVPDDHTRFKVAVAAAVAKHNVNVVLPITDSASRALLGEDDALGARVAGPSLHAYLRASDKRALLSIAPSFGIRVPRQVTIVNRGDPIGDASHFAAVVVKPAQSVVEVNGKSRWSGVTYVSTSDRLATAIAQYDESSYPLMLQERVYGVGVGVFLLRQKGQTLLQFGHRRLREKPPAGGVSTYREATVPPAALVSACERLLDAVGYDGAAMVEFKQDVVTGEFVLMEINARLWGSVQLAIDAGADFPSALVHLAMGQPLPALPPLRAGVRSMWELGELDHMWALLRRSPEALQLPPGEKSGVPAVLKALFSRRLGDRPEVFRLTDPIPFLAELSRWIRAR